MADIVAGTVAVRLRLIGPDGPGGSWRAAAVPTTPGGGAATVSAGPSATAAVAALRGELERPGVRVAFWMPTLGDAAPDSSAHTVRVAARLYSPRTMQGSGQWAAATLGWAEALTTSSRLASTVEIGLAGLFAWGDDPADAVRALGAVVLESARGRLRSSWQDWSAVVVFVADLVEPS